MKNYMGKSLGLLLAAFLVISSVNAADVKSAAKNTPEKGGVFSRWFNKKADVKSGKNEKARAQVQRRVVSTRRISARKATGRKVIGDIGDKCSNGRRGKYSAADGRNEK